MTPADIIRLRLANQQLSQHEFKTPGQLVSWLGAVQAQDYLNSKWAIGLRIKNCTEADIERAVAGKTIIRTWPMRGTLHYVAPEDARWMLQLLTPRVIRRAQNIYKLAGLDDKIFLKSRKQIEKMLRDGKLLTRNEIYQQLEKSGVSTAAQRGLHILGKLAQDGIICLGPRKGKQPTFTLLDEWLPPTKKLHHDEAIAKLTKCYFQSHGPATVQDFAWWSGLTVIEIKKGLEMNKSNLINELINGKNYSMGNAGADIKIKSRTVYFLPNYDEYLVAYRDRSLATDRKHTASLASASYFFNPTIIISGKIVGSWKRVFVKNKVNIEIELFTRLSKFQKHSLVAAAQRYSRFLKMSSVVSFK
jgi:hypothetical protein